MTLENLELFEVFIRSARGLDHNTLAACMRRMPNRHWNTPATVTPPPREGVSIWVVKSGDICASQEADSDSFFDPNDDKPYRHATYYPLPKEVGNM